MIIILVPFRHDFVTFHFIYFLFENESCFKSQMLSTLPISETVEFGFNSYLLLPGSAILVLNIPLFLVSQIVLWLGKISQDHLIIMSSPRSCLSLWSVGAKAACFLSQGLQLLPGSSKWQPVGWVREHNHTSPFEHCLSLHTPVAALNGCDIVEDNKVSNICYLVLLQKKGLLNSFLLIPSSIEQEYHRMLLYDS